MIHGDAKVFLSHLGANVREARHRRKWTMQQMADRLGITRKTYSRLESGGPGVSSEILFSTLIALGFEKQLGELADPSKDRIGAALEREGRPKRVRRNSSQELDFEF